MRLDLVINTMFKTAVQDGRITVSNPSIWWPILGIQDAAAAYVRAVEAAPSLSGTFNVASENTTLGALGDQVAATVKRNLDLELKLEILQKADVRNYKVSVDRARVQLGFKPSCDVDEIVCDLVENWGAFADLTTPRTTTSRHSKPCTAEDLGVALARNRSMYKRSTGRPRSQPELALNGSARRRLPQSGRRPGTLRFAGAISRRTRRRMCRGTRLFNQAVV